MDDLKQEVAFPEVLDTKTKEKIGHILSKFREMSQEKEAQYVYLRSVVQHIPIGIFSVDEKATIDFYNKASLQILRCSAMKSLGDFSPSYEPLINFLKSANSKQKKIIRLLIEEEVLELVVGVSEVQILGKTYQIVSLQDFQAELEEKEMEAWQNLTRILSHEIINSVTPISSLASTVSAELSEKPESANEDILEAIQVIEKRSNSLIQFVQEFRAFSKLPTPQPTFVALKEIFTRLEKLFTSEFEQKNIQFKINLANSEQLLYTDIMMLEQILINLLKNAIQAVQMREMPVIEILAETDHLGKALIKVKDNGVGISEDARKSLFIPFFTTKKAGSGIGLSLSRQMMRVQGGTISVHTAQGIGTTFCLHFA
ncbi:MAG: PAS domain-containing sensor histidine kinase [Thermonemataceae bacterium]|nr:PAS domain-containing sensor histidine kinase [Thermonemataceae bacterium]